MAKVPRVQDLDVADRDGEDGELLRVVSVEVIRAKHTRPAIYLTVGAYNLDEGHTRTIDLALSPPAAERLARLLRKEVRAYLRHDPDDPLDEDLANPANWANVIEIQDEDQT